MVEFTHRLFHRDDLGFFAKRALQSGYACDGDGHAIWSDHDEDLLAEAAKQKGWARDQLRNGLEFMDVLFVPKSGFEATGLEALTDDASVCPAGMWAAFPTIR